MLDELHVPEKVHRDPDAQELLRVWRSGGAQWFILRRDAWEDPAAWGVLLVDLAHQVAAAYKDPSGVLARIREGFDAEWVAPTDGGGGG